MTKDIVSKAHEILSEYWAEVCELAEKGQLQDCINDKEIIESIRSSIHSKIKS